MNDVEKAKLPEIPGMVWLRLAIPVPESAVGAWDSMPGMDQMKLLAEVAQAAKDTLQQMMGRPMPVIGDES